jgi:drug/metabolite transporter (DMT)-like permease
MNPVTHIFDFNRLYKSFAPYAGYFCAISAAAIYGAMAVLAKKIATDFASPMVASSFSLLFGFLITAAIFGKNAIDDGTRAPRKSWIFVLGAGCASAFGVSCWYLALTVAPVVIVTPVIAANPLVTIFLTAIFLRNVEQVTPRVILGAGLVIIGVVIIGFGSN